MREPKVLRKGRISRRQGPSRESRLLGSCASKQFPIRSVRGMYVSVRSREHRRFHSAASRFLRGKRLLVLCDRLHSARKGPSSGGCKARRALRSNMLEMGQGATEEKGP